jgi:hypothetical protein
MIRRLLLAAAAVAVTAAGAAAQGAKPGAAKPAAAMKSAPSVARRDTATQEQAAPVVMREAYTYEGAGRRDPFYPLIMTSELRPLLRELVLTSVIFDPTGRRSVAVMRDQSGTTQYRVTTGMLLGRMRVTEIRPKGVFFTIQEFGSDRRDSLLLVDTTKVRR